MSVALELHGRAREPAAADGAAGPSGAAAPADLQSAWAGLFVQALASSGVEHVVVSPGSRSTPLALAVDREPRLGSTVVLDERSAAFFALGRARATGRPVAVLCTSGTAGAHHLPAVIEASLAAVPLVVITADRPWEAQDCGSSQTVDQVKLFGSHVRHQAELGLADPSPAALRAVQRLAAQAVARALSPWPGPVHVNARFRKPLEPVDGPPGSWAPLLAELRRAGPARCFPARQTADPAGIDALAAACTGARRGLILCGPASGDGGALRTALAALSRATGFPILAEATSQARFGLGPGQAPAGGALDAVLLAPAEANSGSCVAPGPTQALACGALDAVLLGPLPWGEEPDLLLELGLPPVSGAHAAFVEAHRGVPRFVVAPHGWNDPHGGATALVSGECAAVATELAERLGGSREPGPWSSALVRREGRAWELAARLSGGDELTEATVARTLVAALPAGATLIAGNSSPVRDLDAWCPPGGAPLTVLHQRGAAGIDGLVSGAAGAASAHRGPVALLLGDLSLLHDLAGLKLAAAAPGPLVIVVVNNDGGRIFEQLPLARRPDPAGALERLFVAPQGLCLGAAATLYGIPHVAPASVPELRAALAAALLRDGPTLVEARVPPRDGGARRRRLVEELSGMLAGPEEGPGLR